MAGLEEGIEYTINLLNSKMNVKRLIYWEMIIYGL
jgi:hypothetical protein